MRKGEKETMPEGGKNCTRASDQIQHLSGRQKMEKSKSDIFENEKMSEVLTENQHNCKQNNL
jgi:hypothetical protein